jgi:hypothetical protein
VALTSIIFVQHDASQATPLSDQPALQLAQIAVLFEVQFAPDAPIPFEQVQMLAWITILYES